jgi:hypothetical protein
LRNEQGADEPAARYSSSASDLALWGGWVLLALATVAAMPRLVRLVWVLVCAQLLAAAAAIAKPQLEDVDVQYGVVAQVSGVGCTSASLTRSIAGEVPVEFQPAVGEDVGYAGSIVVTGTTLGEGQVAWAIQPTVEECEYYKDDPSWAWSTAERAWGVTHEASLYTIRASRHGGVRSVAGFQMRTTRRSAPTIRKAQRYFGRPSSRRRDAISCRLRWDRIGLTIVFWNLGIGNPCRHGLVQYGHVKGRAASRWTTVVARDPGVALGTTDEFLDSELIGEPHESDQAWTLADVYIPYGDSGYYPSVTALLNDGRAVRGFEFWVGAAGD